MEIKRPTLCRGMTGTGVRAVQRALGVQPLDGLFGAKTEAAVKAFQRQQGLRRRAHKQHIEHIALG